MGFIEALSAVLAVSVALSGLVRLLKVIVRGLNAYDAILHSRPGE